MLFQFSFDGTESLEARKAAADCILALGGKEPSAVRVVNEVAPAVTVTVTEAAPATDVAKPKRTRKAAESQPDPVAAQPQSQVAEVAQNPTPTGGTATKDDLRAAIESVVQSGPSGMQDAISLLKAHGAMKVSDVSEDKYAAVIAACREKTAAKASAGAA